MPSLLEGRTDAETPTAGSANIVFHLPADSLRRSSGRRSASTNKPAHALGAKPRLPCTDTMSSAIPLSGCTPARH